MIRKILKYAGITIAGVIVLVPCSALLYRKYLQYEVVKRRAITSTNGIDSLEAVTIGGIKQWIQTRGQNVNNPILLFIHGGPGIGFIPLSGSFQGSWEQYFTVVQWDQRGAGKTYASNDQEIQRKTMNVPQMEQDAVEVMNYVRSRYKRDKIFVLGHSWGSILGLWLAHEHPEGIYAYVGTGQVVNMQQNDGVSYKDALQKARITQNAQAVRDLEGIGPYPFPAGDFRRSSTARFWEGQLLSPPPGTPQFMDVRRILMNVVSSPDYSLRDDLGFIRGQQLSLGIFLPQMAKVDLTSLGFDYAEPIFFLEGRNDPFCRPSLVADYLQEIAAPHKELVWLEKSGHFPFFEEPERFKDLLVQRVLPLANASVGSFTANSALTDR